MSPPGIKALHEALFGGGHRGLDQGKVQSFLDLRQQGYSPSQALQLAELGPREIHVLQARGELGDEASNWSSQQVGGADRNSGSEHGFRSTYSSDARSASSTLPGKPDIPTPGTIAAPPGPGAPDVTKPSAPSLGRPEAATPGAPSTPAASTSSLARPDVATSSAPNPAVAASAVVGTQNTQEGRGGRVDQASRPDASRTDASQNINAQPQTASTTRTDAVRDPGNVIQARQDGRQAPNPEPDAAERGRGGGRRGDEGRAVNNPHGRDAVQGNAQSTAQAQVRERAPQTPAASVHGRTDGGSAQVINTATVQVVAQQSAPQSGNTQAFAPQQAPSGDHARAEQARFESPVPQNARAGEAAASSLRSADAGNQTAAPADRNITTTQQQLHPQYNAAVPQAQGRPESLFGSLAPQQQSAQLQGNPQAQARPDALAAQAAALAGAAAMTMPMPNPQAHTMVTQVGQNALPTPAGVDSAAAARDPLLAPAGHTLAGFFRRDHRGGQSPLNRPFDWFAALLPGTRKRPQGSEPEVMSSQWLFWILIVVAYGALGTAAVLMIPNGGQLVTPEGTPATGAYALVLGALAAIGSWFIAKRMR